MIEPEQRPATDPKVFEHIPDFTLHLVVYAAAGLVVIIGLWWVGRLALLVSGAEPQGSILTAFGRLAAAFGAMGLVAVLIADVVLGWGVCVFAGHRRQDQEDPT
ncbi:MAG: hypothetical protein ACYCZN_01295 [Candidatus Dormibacteria bacterium]